jgi:hypothetical protein
METTTVTVYITPLRNGTVLTSTERLDVTTSETFEKRAIITSIVPFTYVVWV